MLNYPVQVGEFDDDAPAARVGRGRLNPSQLGQLYRDESHLYFGREGQVGRYLLNFRSTARLR